MIPYHIHADLASERRNTLLAEAEAFRLAKQARSHRQRAGTSAGRRGRAESRGRAAQNLAAERARDLRKYPAAMRRSGMARRSQAGTRAGAALLRAIGRPVRGKAGRTAGGQAGQAETGRRRWAVLAVVSAAQFLTILDLWVVNIALPALQHDFAPATLSDLSWILDVYAIVLAALLLPAGRAADSIGRRECFLAGLVVFGVASLGCAVAPDLPALIACRALQAAGAAVLMPTSLGLALSVFPSHQRGTAVGVWAGVGAVAAGSGPVLGGLLVESSWRWIFLINVPIILATLAAGVAILPRRGGERGSERSGQRPGWRIDGVGTFLVLGAVGLVCTALTEAPGWPPSRTWPVLAAGLVLAAAFVAHIRRHPDPLVAPRLFSVRPFSAGAVGLVAYYTGFAAMLLGTTLLLTVQWHFSVLQAAVSIAPGPITAGIVSPFSGRLSARFGMRDHGRGGRRAFRGGRGLAPGQRRRRPRLRGGRAAEHAAVGRGQRAHPAFAVRLRRRRAASGAGVGVSSAGHGTPARVGPGCGDLRGRARRPPGNGPGRVRPCLDRCPDHRGHDRLRRPRHRPAAEPCPGGGQG